MELIVKAGIIISLTVLIYIAVEVTVVIIEKTIRWHRRRKADRRIIRQAKALDVWDKKPLVLGGRALELKAWQDFNIKRKPGESDTHLRGRCFTAAGDYDAYVHAISIMPRYEKTTKRGRKRK